MSTPILVPLDGSSQAFGALEYALEQYAEPTITMVHVTDPTELLRDIPVQLTDKSASDEADEIFNEAQAVAADYDASCTPVAEVGQPARVIVSYIEENDIDQIIMGSHGRTGASRVLLGSVAEAVVRRAPTPVTVIRSLADTDNRQQSGRVLVPIDGSESSDIALEYALEAFPDADFVVLHVTEPIEGYERNEGLDPESEDTVGTYLEEWIEEADERAESLFDDARSVAEEHGTKIGTASKPGQPKRQVVTYAETNRFDHIVIGSHGRTGASRILLGSVAETIVRRAHCPVTVVR